MNEEFSVVHMSDRVGRYLRVPGGEPSREVLRMVHPDLRADLRAALHQAVRERRRVEITGVSVQLDDERRSIDIIVGPKSMAAINRSSTLPGAKCFGAGNALGQ